jgi:hypothetical protein
MEGDLTFEQWLESIGGITESGRSKLEKATIVSLTAVRLITEHDIDEIKLALGDRAIFKAGWKKLNGVTQPTVTTGENPGPSNTGGPEPGPSTSHTSYSFSDIAELMKLLPQATSPAPVVTSPAQALQQTQSVRSRFGILQRGLRPKPWEKTKPSET